MSYRKYRNKRSVDAEGNKFDSNMERRRWEELKIMEAGGLIFNLRRQVPYDLIAHEVTICRYVADHVYRRVEPFNTLGPEIVEDVKGVRTAEYRLKKKLMLALHGIAIYEWPERKRKKRK